MLPGIPTKLLTQRMRKFEALYVAILSLHRLHATGIDLHESGIAYVIPRLETQGFPDQKFRRCNAKYSCYRYSTFGSTYHKRVITGTSPEGAFSLTHTRF